MSNRPRNHTRSQAQRLSAFAFGTLLSAACSDAAMSPGTTAAGHTGATDPPPQQHQPPLPSPPLNDATLVAMPSPPPAAQRSAPPSPPPSVAGAAAPALPTDGVCDGTRSFTRAVRLEIDVDWPATIGLDAGKGQVIVYSKLSYRKSGDQWLTEGRPCGTDLPVITTSLLVNNLKSLNHIPSSAFDSPRMPVMKGAVASADGMLRIDTGGGLFGVDLPDPASAWPALEAIRAVDHDGDGKPGVTAFPEIGEGYIVPPLSVTQDRVADRIYVGARVRFTLRAPRQRCEELTGGTATIDGFDYSIVGCHAMDGVECVESETRFLARAAPVFNVAATGRWAQHEVSDDANCATVQAAFAP